MSLLRQTLCRHTAVNYLKVGGMHNLADRKYEVLFPCVCVSMCVRVTKRHKERERERDDVSVILPVVAISHLNGALLKLLQWTGCPLNTFHLCLHRFIELILNIY